MRLLLTRHPGQAGELEAQLRQAGITLGFLPVTQQLLPEDTEDLSTAVYDLEMGHFDRLLLTSANTVRALLASGWTGQLPSHTSICAVGPGTARVLTELTGHSTAWMPQQHSGAGILTELPAPKPGERILLPQSAQARPELAAGLRERHWVLTHVRAYETVALSPYDQPPPHRLSLTPSPASKQTREEQSLLPSEVRPEDAVLLTSPTAATAYVELHLRAKPALLAMGAPTAETMNSLNLPVAATLTAPTIEGVKAAFDRIQPVGGHHPSSTDGALDWPPIGTTPGGKTSAVMTPGASSAYSTNPHQASPQGGDR